MSAHVSITGTDFRGLEQLTLTRARERVFDDDLPRR
jgi:hypothetical protein